MESWNTSVVLLYVEKHPIKVMKFPLLLPLKVLGLAALLSSPLSSATAQNLDPGSVWVYHLIEGSTIVDDCPICDRVPIVEPVRGTFELRSLENGPLFSSYSIQNLYFTNTGSLGQSYTVSGSGVFQIGGEFFVKLSLYLELWIDNGITNRLCYFATNWAGLNRPWPMFQVSVDQTNGTPAQQFHLDLNAAPFREIWFSPASDFSSAISNAVLSNGDLLSNQGRRVKTNAQLLRHFVPMPATPDLGLKDFDILSGGEIAFSLEQDTWSEALGVTLHPGDLLSNRGTILRTNQSLLAAFLPGPPTEVGLAAVQVISPSETWFSVQTNFFSMALNSTVTSGDLLSDSGTVVRSNTQLLSRFKPTDPAANAGLKAVYAWPSGEIWFSTDKVFTGGDLTQYAPGDILSDQGYVVCRNAELLSAFAPTVTTNIPLDGLWVVTDVISEPRPVLFLPPLPRLINAPPAAMLSWRGPGHVYQLERALTVGGPYTPIGPITPDSAGNDTGVTNSPWSFYRVHQW